ncbi:hypothetical protein [Corallococcus llansteffanensis]|uniref:Uncharacterized protein n=1 Tax=Corallococcus llansteffanensis TaxID=2316731 RepID=A0A3A8QIC7_9BACT|nr:hypothetical protein [Corallococcus llansteffanensis]RKH66670.1 hypothetical protein D7V93_04020 [Corallococcus llansteffanensis]
MSLTEAVVSLFAAPPRPLCWFRLADDHVLEKGYRAEPIRPREDYVVLRMREMSLRFARKLWRSYYPVLHGFVRHGTREENTLAGPGQLKDLSDSHLERIINLNQRLAGPIPYDGGDLSLVVGLYSVPAEEAAKALIQTVTEVAKLAGLALGPAPQLALVVKTGVESIFKLDKCQLQLGIRDTFSGETALTTGVYVGLAAPRDTVRESELWLDKGRLSVGADPIIATPYTQHDYMILAIERRTERDDWGTLPAFSDFEAKSAKIMGGPSSPPEKRKELNMLWPEFLQALDATRELTPAHRKKLKGAILGDLLSRLTELEQGNPFETRSVNGAPARVRSDDFSLLDVDTDSPSRDAGPNPFG